MLTYQTKRADVKTFVKVMQLPYWNLDLSVRKNIRTSERFSTEFQSLRLNTPNHMVFAIPVSR